MEEQNEEQEEQHEEEEDLQTQKQLVQEDTQDRRCDETETQTVMTNTNTHVTTNNQVPTVSRMHLRQQQHHQQLRPGSESYNMFGCNNNDISCNMSSINEQSQFGGNGNPAIISSATSHQVLQVNTESKNDEK